MPQLVRTASELVQSSAYLIGELGVDEAPDAFMIRTGIELVNEILDNLNQDNIFIPYQTTLSFNFTPNQGTYSISNVAGITPDVAGERILDLVFAEYTVEDQITYPLKIVSKAEYYQIVRLEDLDTRPAIVFLDKQASQSNVVFYPVPDQNYACNLYVKSMLDSLAASDELNNLPPKYYGYLKYALARKMRLYYPSGQWSPQAEDEYQQLFENMKNTNETDLTIRPSGMLVRDEPTYWWTNILAL